MSEAHPPDHTTTSSVVHEADNTTSNAAFLVNIKNQISLLHFWWLVVIIPVGITGNVLCFLVMSQKHNRSVSCSVYLRALAVADTIHIITPAMYSILFTGRFNLLQETTSVTLVCKVLSFCALTSGQCGSLLILALLVERVIVVCKPMKAASLLSPNRALITFTTIAFAALVNVPIIFFTSATKSASTVDCSVNAVDLGRTIYGISVLFLNGVLPLASILVMNLIILFTFRSSKDAFRKLRKAKKYYKQTKETISTASGRVDILETPDDMLNSGGNIKLDILDHPVSASCASRSETRHSQSQPVAAGTDTHTSASSTMTSHSQRNTQLTIMTVTMTLAFLVCMMPKSLLILISNKIEFQSSASKEIVFLVSLRIIQMLSTLNSAINFYIYILTGSKFRADCRNLFCSRREDAG